jgi:hypothetical protein
VVRLIDLRPSDRIPMSVTLRCFRKEIR